MYDDQGKTPLIVEDVGVLTADIIPYMDIYFETINGDVDITSANSLMLTTLKQSNEMAHAILVIGIEGNDWVYFDPSDGKQHKTPITSITTPNVIISGAK